MIIYVENLGKKNLRFLGILLYLKWIIKKTYCISQGTLLEVMWQSRWEGGLGQDRYMYMYG